MPKANTIATAKYQAKVGLVAKTYKLKADIAEAFKTACEASGKSQAAVLTRFMQEYASGINGKKTKTTPTDEQENIFKSFQGVKCVRCGTMNEGYIDGYFRCSDCEFGNYEPCEEDVSDNDEADTEHDNSDEIILKKWKTRLKSATKKAGLPCVYQYGYGKAGPHFFVNNEKTFIPQDEAAVLIRIGAVHENIQAD